MFVDAYTTPGAPTFGNATRSAILAGFAPKSADAQGARLLKDDRVAGLLHARQQEVQRAAQFDREAALFLALEQANAWRRGGKKAKPDATSHASLELACKIAGIRTPLGEPFNRHRTEITGPDGGPLKFDMGQLQDRQLVELETLLRMARVAQS